MNRWFLMLLCLIMCLALPACRTESDEAWEALMGKPKPVPTPAPMNAEAEEPEAGDGLRGTLTISQYVSTQSDPIPLLAKEFMKLHPGVKIDIENYIGLFDLLQENQDQMYERYQAQLRMQLISGEAADIILETTGLNLRTLSQSGVLRDMRDNWERDMDSEEFFTPVIDLGVVEGKMCVAPYNFSASMVYVNRRVADGLGLDLSQRAAIRTDEMIDWYNQARDQGLLEPDAPMVFDQPKDWYSQLFDLERSRYLDQVNHIAHFDNSCVHFLQALQNLPAGLVTQTAYSNTSTPAVVNELIRCRATGQETSLTNDDSVLLGRAQHRDYVLGTKEGLFLLDNLDNTTLRDAAENPCEYLAGPFLVANSAGQVAMNFYRSLAITSCCREPELAWEFIKYCLSTREAAELSMMVDYNGSGICTNRQNQWLTAQKKRLSMAGQPEYNNLGWYWVSDPAPEAMSAALDRLLSVPLINAKLYNMEDVNGYLDEFLVHRLTTAEQCAQKLQEQAYIWLNE